MQNALEASKLVVRMTADDRQAINRMIRHKCEEFESVVQKGVVAMLNAQEESEKLAEKRAEYLSFLSTRNQQKKEQLRQISQATREAVSSAPMGMDAAGQVVISSAARAGDALLDSAEQKRQQTEAEERLFSAQMLFYIPPQDYEKIAKRVAGILSYRYQLLIFRLAAGEDGYIKLANFFVSSMKNYAIARLREQKNNVVRALINAAIPPSTDTIRYRDWPSIDIANFRTRLSRCGTRKTLELDEAANQIVKRCGPAVRALLGGYLTYVDPDTGLIKNYQAYTIIGALNHSLILNGDARIHAGILPKHRPYLALDGNVKYPIILLGQGETTADLGVNFATQTTDVILDEIHCEALKRLVPNFFTHEVSYQLDKACTEVSSFGDVRYAEEKYECPWTQKRQNLWQQRLQAIFLAKKEPFAVDEIEAFDESSQLRAMLTSANQHYLNTKLEDAQAIDSEAQEAIALVFQTHGDLALQKKYAADTAKYALFATQELMYSMHYAQNFSREHFSLARKLIESANLAIFASRDFAFIETFKYQETLLGIQSMSKTLKAIQATQQLYESHFHIILEAIEDLPYFIHAQQIIERETQSSYRKVRLLRTQISEHLREMQKMVEMGQAIMQYDEEFLSSPLNLETAYQEVLEEIARYREAFYAQTPEDIPGMIHLMKMGLEESHFLLSFLENIQKKPAGNPVSVELGPEGMLVTLREELTQHQAQLLQLQSQETLTGWFVNAQYQARMEQTAVLLETVKSHSQSLHRLFQKITYAFHHEDAEITQRVQSFFKRALFSMQFNFLSYLNTQTSKDDHFQILYQKTKRLYLCHQLNATQLAEQQYQRSLEFAGSLTREMSVTEVSKMVQQIKKDKNDLELRVRHDIEIFDLGIARAHLIYRDAEPCFQDMLEMTNKLESIRENTDKIEFLNFDAAYADDAEYRFKTQEEIISYFEAKCFEIMEQVLQLELFPADEHEFLQTRMKLELNHFKDSLKDNPHLPFNQLLGIHFLCKVVKSIAQIEFKKITGFQTLSELKKQFDRLSGLNQTDLCDLNIAQKKALKLLKKSFHGMLILNQKAKRFRVEASLSDLRQTGYTKSTLIWSGRLSIAEQKWIDKKINRQSRKLLENATDYKSPSRMAFSFIFALVNEHLISKKRNLNRLRKIENDLEKIKLLPLDLDSSTPEENLTHERLLQQKRQFTQIIDSKIRIFEKELDDLALSRKLLVRKVIGLFFFEWKEKSFESPPTQHSFFKLAQVIANQKTAAIEATLSTAEVTEAQYSIEALETWFESFNKSCEQCFSSKFSKNSSELSEELAAAFENSLMSPKKSGSGLRN